MIDRRPILDRLRLAMSLIRQIDRVGRGSVYIMPHSWSMLAEAARNISILNDTLGFHGISTSNNYPTTISYTHGDSEVRRVWDVHASRTTALLTDLSDGEFGPALSFDQVLEVHRIAKAIDGFHP